MIVKSFSLIVIFDLVFFSHVAFLALKLFNH